VSDEIVVKKINRMITKAQKRETDAESDGTCDGAFWNGYWSSLVKIKQHIEQEKK
jgi:hypothetical protein